MVGVSCSEARKNSLEMNLELGLKSLVNSERQGVGGHFWKDVALS